MRSRIWLTAIALAAALPLAGCGLGGNNPVGGATGQISRADDQATAIKLQSAAASMEQGRATSGSYEGVVPGDLSVQVVRADATSYCLQAESRTGTLHLAGPGGTVALGGC